MKTLRVAFVVALPILFLITAAHAYVLEKGSDGGFCKMQNPMNITYFNGASSLEINEVPYAVEAWNDVPAHIHFLSWTPDTAIIQVMSNTDPNFQKTGGVQYDAIAFTIGSPSYALTCSQGYSNTPLEILFNDAAGALQGKSYSYITGTVGHEFSHVLGLDESSDKNSLDFIGGDIRDSEGIYFPILDDVKGVAYLYGWAGDEPLPSGYGTAASGGTPPIHLKVSAAGSGAYSSQSQYSGL